MKDNVGQRAPAHRSPRQDPCFDPLIRSPVSRDSRAAASGSFLDWKGLRLAKPQRTRFRTAPTAILFLFIKIHREDPVLDRVAGVEIDRAHNPSSPP